MRLADKLNKKNTAHLSAPALVVTQHANTSRKLAGLLKYGSKKEMETYWKNYVNSIDKGKGGKFSRFSNRSPPSKAKHLPFFGGKGRKPGNPNDPNPPIKVLSKAQKEINCLLAEYQRIRMVLLPLSFAAFTHNYTQNCFIGVFPWNSRLLHDFPTSQSLYRRPRRRYHEPRYSQHRRRNHAKKST